jgi:hypothetical protein
VSALDGVERPLDGVVEIMDVPSGRYGFMGKRGVFDP